MARDLDQLIQKAKRLEPPSSDDRARVRAGLEQSLAANGSAGAAASTKALSLVGASVLGLALVTGIAIAVTRASPESGSRLQAPGSSLQPEQVVPAPAVAGPSLQDSSRTRAEAPAQLESRPQPRTLSRAKPDPSRKPPALIGLTEESRGLSRVNQVLRAGSPASALALLDQQDREFAAGGLVAERAAARVLALCAAGRTAEAKAKADAFLREHADSPLRARVQGSCVAAK
jgi:hypothetical protein